jgi:pyruvate kinase
MFGIENDIDYIAASFIRKADDVNAILKVLEDNGAGDIHIISKIENRQGVDNIDEIIEASRGVMVARGDLGVEIPTEEVPMVQKMIIRKCNNQSKPVITATQMLDSMIRNPRPTRAEATDIANAILDGTDAIMLSGETAAGKYPLESIKTMVNIARITEESIDYRKALEERRKLKTESVTYAVSHATCSTALDLNATAIITTTSSGYTPRMVSKFRPKAPIIAATSSEKVRRRMALLWGVYSVATIEGHSTDDIFNKAIQKSKEAGYIKDGELIIITAGVPVGVAGSTNVMKVHIVGEILIKGTGIGKKHVTGSVFTARDAKQLGGFKEGDILVCENTDIDMMHAVEKSSGLIVEGGGYTSHAAIVGLSLGLPVIVGAKDAVEKLRTGQIVTIDCIRGLVYNGKTRVI